MKRPHLYTLDADGNPVPCDDVLVWGRWFNDVDRHVGRWSDGSGVTVSTVFLALDHNYSPHGPPTLWETMVFGLEDSGSMESRYSSKDDALKGHDLTVKRVQAILQRRKQEENAVK